MEPIDRQSKEFSALDKYTQDTHGSTHSHYKARVQHAFRVERCVLVDITISSSVN